MASQAAQSWAPPAAALPFAVVAYAVADPTGHDVSFAAAAALVLGYVAALVGAALAARFGSLVDFGGAVGGFTAGLVLAVPGFGVLSTALDPCDASGCRNGVPGAVVVGVLAVALVFGCRWMVRVYGASDARDARA